MSIVRLGLAMVVAAVLSACGAPALTGTDLGQSAAPDFLLTDGITGSAVHLSALRPKTVALAFLYTHCTDVCPLTAEEFRQAQAKLGSDASKVVFVAVSVDPVGDTPAAVRAFSETHGLTRDWHYLIGSDALLRTVWASYAVQGGSSPSGGVTHNDAIYLIDGQGRERVLLHSDSGADAIANDLRILAR